MNFTEYLQSKDYSRSTIAGHHKRLNRFIQWAGTEQIEVVRSNRIEILSYIGFLKQSGVGQRTISSYLNTLTHYYNYQIAKGIRDDNPTETIQLKGIPKRKLYHILSPKELESLYSSYRVEEKENNPLTTTRNKVIIGLLIWQGLDTTGLQALEVNHLQLRAGNITIPGSRKSNARTLKLEAAQVMDLMEYQLQARGEILKESGKITNRLIISTGIGLSIENVLKQLLKELKTNYPKLENLRQIRTSVITHWLKQYNLREVQYRAGHKYVSSTEAYQINDLEDLQEDINKYYPL